MAMASKQCFIPSCSNNSNDNADLLFVPILERLREEWCRKVNVEYFKNYRQFCCEEHLSRDDIKNYYKCKLLHQQPQMAHTAQLRHIPLAKPKSKRPVVCELPLQHENTPSAKPKRRKIDEKILTSTSASTFLFKKVGGSDKELLDKEEDDTDHDNDASVEDTEIHDEDNIVKINNKANSVEIYPGESSDMTTQEQYNEDTNTELALYPWKTHIEIKIEETDLIEEANSRERL